MKRRAVSLLVVFALTPIASALAPASTADAAMIVLGSKVRKEAKNKYRVLVSGETNDAAASVALQLRSEAGDEDLPLVETNAWLHANAAVTVPLSRDAALTLALYDAAGTEILTFSGSLGADGAVSLDADTPDSGACTSRLGCDSVSATDLSLLATELFFGLRDGSPDGSATMSFDLSGADTYEVASAVLTLTEGSGDCTSRAGCEGSELVSTTAELSLEAVGSVWEAEATLDHQGPIDLRAEVQDSRGHRLERVDTLLGAPWLNDGACVNTLSTDDDPMTSLTLYDHFGSDQFAGGHVRTPRMVIVSEDWTAGDALPTHAQLELTGGETLVIPANSYQRVRRRPELLYAEWDNLLSERRNPTYTTTLSLTRNSSPEPLIAVGTPVCGAGFCAVVSERAAGGYELAATAVGDDPDALPDALELEMTVVDEAGEVVLSETFFITLDDTITAVFAADLAFTADSFGAALAGQVQLLGEADRRGRQDTLARGRFYSAISRGGEGELALAGADHTEVHHGSDLVLSGAAVAMTTAPAVLQYGSGAEIPGLATTVLSDAE